MRNIAGCERNVGFVLFAPMPPVEKGYDAMDMTHFADAAAAKPEPATALPGQVVLAFQGGGALNAYQGGVYQAFHEAGRRRRMAVPGPC
jgi:predicted acylesterase/phospholipase RssA